jgi:hypothetical protein
MKNILFGKRIQLAIKIFTFHQKYGILTWLFIRPLCVSANENKSAVNNNQQPNMKSLKNV